MWWPYIHTYIHYSTAPTITLYQGPLYQLKHRCSFLRGLDICPLTIQCSRVASWPLFQADQEIERAVSSGRKDKEIFLSAVEKKRRSEFLCLWYDGDMAWLRWLWGEISRNRNFFQLLLGANGLRNVPLGVLWPRQNWVYPHDQKRYESTWEASKRCTARGWCQKAVQGLVDQSASRKRLKCQGVFMCTPLWCGTMAVYRFLASALLFNTGISININMHSTLTPTLTSMCRKNSAGADHKSTTSTGLTTSDLKSANPFLILVSSDISFARRLEMTASTAPASRNLSATSFPNQWFSPAFGDRWQRPADPSSLLLRRSSRDREGTSPLSLSFETFTHHWGTTNTRGSSDGVLRASSTAVSTPLAKRKPCASVKRCLGCR